MRWCQYGKVVIGQKDNGDDRKSNTTIKYGYFHTRIVGLPMP